MHGKFWEALKRPRKYYRGPRKYHQLDQSLQFKSSQVLQPTKLPNCAVIVTKVKEI